MTVEGPRHGSRHRAANLTGTVGQFRRTANRHDFAMPPRGETLLDKLTEKNIPVTAIGKIKDLFAGKGIGRVVLDGPATTRAWTGSRSRWRASQAV